MWLYVRIIEILKNNYKYMWGEIDRTASNSAYVDFQKIKELPEIGESHIKKLTDYTKDTRISSQLKSQIEAFLNDHSVTVWIKEIKQENKTVKRAVSPQEAFQTWDYAVKYTDEQWNVSWKQRTNPKISTLIKKIETLQKTILAKTLSENIKLVGLQHWITLTDDGSISEQGYTELQKLAKIVWVDTQAIIPKAKAPVEKRDVSDANLIAKEVLNIKTNPTVEQIKAFQKGNNIAETGKIDQVTYIELTAELLFKSFNQSNFSKLLSSQESQKDIMYVMQNGDPKYKWFLKFSLMLKSFHNTIKKKWPQDPDFIAHNDFLTKALNESNKTLTSKHHSADKTGQNTKWADWETLYAKIKKWDWEWIIKDPMLLIGAGIMFLFWVIWWKTKYTDSFMKRAWIIFAGAVFWKAAWAKIGWDEIIADIKWVAGSTPKPFTPSNDAQRKWADWMAWLWASANNLWNNIKKEFGAVVGTFAWANEAFKDNPETQDKYIETAKFTVLNSVIPNDTTFLYTPVNTVKGIHTYGQLSPYLSQEALSKINELYTTDSTNKERDIKNYIQEHIVKSFDKDDVFVRDIGLTTSFLDSLKKTTVESTIAYNNNASLNKVIATKVWSLVHSWSDIQKLAGYELALKIKAGKVDDFNINEFAALSEAEKTEINTLIETVQYINIQEKYIVEQTQAIQKIDSTHTDSAPQNEETIKAKIEEFYMLKNSFNLSTKATAPTGSGIDVSQFDRSKYDKAVLEKQSELFDVAVNQINPPLTSIVIGSETINLQNKITELKTDKEVQGKVEELTKLVETLWEVPKSSATPLIFREYWEKHKATFESIQALKENPNIVADPKIDNLFIQASERKEKFIANYEKVKVRYIGKITTIEKAIITTIPTPLDAKGIITERAKLQKQLADLEIINADIMQGMTLSKATNWAVDLYKKYTNTIRTVNPDDNSFDYLDTELDSQTANVPTITAIQSIITNRWIELEGSFDMTMNVPMPELYSNIVIGGTYIKELKEKQRVVESFQIEKVIKEKMWELQVEWGNIVDSFINWMEKPGIDIAKLEQIKTSYNDLKEVLWDIIPKGRKNDVENKYDRAIEILEQVKVVVETAKETTEIEKRLSWILYTHETFNAWLPEYGTAFTLIEKNKAIPWYEGVYEFVTKANAWERSAKELYQQLIVLDTVLTEPNQVITDLIDRVKQLK